MCTHNLKNIKKGVNIIKWYSLVIYNINEENSIFINFIIGHIFIMFICKYITVEANSNISVDNYEQNYWAVYHNMVCV